MDREHKTMRFEAGISLHELNTEARKVGLTIQNLGSIDDQSVAGAIATGTHGSSLRHGLVSDQVRELRIMLASGEVVTCSADENRELFRAASLSLGALGIVVEIEMEMASHCNIEWRQSIQPLSYVFDNWDTSLWRETEFVRVWWLPHTKRAIVWKADKTDKSLRSPRKSRTGGKLLYYTYYLLLLLSHKLPQLLPSIEWLVFGLQYGFRTGDSSVNGAVQEQREGLLMDCLYSQLVNEWAIPLDKGPEAIRRLSAWLNGVSEQVTNIPFDNKNLYVHAPIEVRVTNTSDISFTPGKDSTHEKAASRPRPFLDLTVHNPPQPTLYFNATLYRPWGLSPPSHKRYYDAFEHVMRQLGGRPHWAKNFRTVTNASVRSMYGGVAEDKADSGGTTAATASESDKYNNSEDRLSRWLAVRAKLDPDGMFVGDWHRRLILGSGDDVTEGQKNNEDRNGKESLGSSGAGSNDVRRRGGGGGGLPLEEVQVSCKSASDGGVDWFGKQVSCE